MDFHKHNGLLLKHLMTLRLAILCSTQTHPFIMCTQTSIKEIYILLTGIVKLGFENSWKEASNQKNWKAGNESQKRLQLSWKEPQKVIHSNLPMQEIQCCSISASNPPIKQISTPSEAVCSISKQFILSGCSS